MAEQVKQHFLTHRAQYFVYMICAIIGIAAFLSLFGAFGASASVTSVTLADNDTTNYGADGRDIYISWNTGSEPSGYELTKAFVVTSGVDVNLGNVDQFFGITYSFFSETSVTFTKATNYDAQENPLVTTTPYVAWVYVSGTTKTLVSSSPVSLVFDRPADTKAPSIEHFGVHTATEGQASFFYAFLDDDQTTASQFGNTGDGGDEYFQLVYTSSTFDSVSTTVDGSLLGSNLYEFGLAPGHHPNSSSTYSYYLKAEDAAGNTRVFCASPTAVTEEDCQGGTTAFTGTMNNDDQSRTISGTVTDFEQNGIGEVYVFAGGYAGQAVTTSATGSYALGNLPDYQGYDVAAGGKNGYCKQLLFILVQGNDVSQGTGMFLSSDLCTLASGGSGDDGGAPKVLFSNPPEGAHGFPIDKAIVVGFDQPMDPININTNDPTSDESGISLRPTAGGAQKVGGRVVYCETQNSNTDCSNNLQSGDVNAMIFIPNSDLSASTEYALVMNNGTTGANGLVLSGNNSDGGHTLVFNTFAGAYNENSNALGSSGSFMPPFVRSVSPAPGIAAAQNANILVEFNEPMDDTVAQSNTVALYNSAGSVVAASVSIDSSKKYVTINPTSNLSAGDYEVRVKGSAKNQQGITMMKGTQSASTAFSTAVIIESGTDTSGPTVYSYLVDGTSDVSVSAGQFEFGFDEQLLPSTVNSDNFVLKRGNTEVATEVDYDPGLNRVLVIPEAVLAPNSQYSITVTTDVTDINGNALGSQSITSFSTGQVDNVDPSIVETRCDDSSCIVKFSEPMNQDLGLNGGSNNSSVLRNDNISITVNGGSNIAGASGVTLTYDSADNALHINGLSGLEGSFTISLSNLVDLSNNSLVGSTQTGVVESSEDTFGSFQEAGMFGPPKSAVTFSEGSGNTFGEFKPEGFGQFTALEAFNGTITEVFPYNRGAGQSSQYKLKFTPAVQVSSGDIFEVILPNGTTFTGINLGDSPVHDDINGSGEGTVTVSVSSTDSTQRKVKFEVVVSGGSTGGNDTYEVDFVGVQNPLVPKGPNSGGYTAKVRLLRQGQSGLSTIVTKTSMPYFIDESGSNEIAVTPSVQGTPASADGTVYLLGGGPTGPMDKQLTLTNGEVSMVNGNATTTVRYLNLPDGCYSFHTEPLVTLGDIDYIGLTSPEPICVGSSLGEATSKTMGVTYLPAQGSGGSATTTVKIQGVDFNNRDVEIFAGGPSKFFSKPMSSLGDLTSSPTTTEIYLTEDGPWFIGIGPAHAKGFAGAESFAEPLPGILPAPIQVVATGVGTANADVEIFTQATSDVQFNNDTDTIFFTISNAGTSVNGEVRDKAGTAVGDAEIFIHQQGLGAPIVTRTSASGTFSASVGGDGLYEVGVRKDGMPGLHDFFEVEGGTVFYDGEAVDNAGIELIVSKGSLVISGKVLDEDEEPIAYMPVMVTDSIGNTVFTGTESDGTYAAYVNENDTYTLRPVLPPNVDTCGTFTKTVTVTTANVANQTIEPSSTSCKTLSGSVTVGGTALANTPVFIEEIDVNDNPVIGGEVKMAVTDSSGDYSVQVTPDTDYRVGIWHPDHGERSVTADVENANKTANLTMTESNVGFSFSGGTDDMEAFIEIKNASDVTKRTGEHVSDLTGDKTLSAEDGATYNYFVDVFGFGKFSGSVNAGSTTTIDVSIADLVTVTGTVRDADGAVLEGALVTFSNSSTAVYKSAITDVDGLYSVSLRANSTTVGDKYQVATSLSGYVAPESFKLVSYTANTGGYDFGGNDSPEHQGLARATKRIAGTINASSGSGNPVEEGFVMATHATTGVRVKAPISGDGTYALNVTAGEWRVEGIAPGHVKTAGSSNVTVASGDTTQTQSITLTAGSGTSRSSTSTAGVVAGNTGGSVNSEATGIKMTAGAGVLQTGSGNVTVNMERNFTAPESEIVRPLGDALFDITATGNSSIKNLNGNMELVIDYTDIVANLPSDVDEEDLLLMWYSNERNEYVPVEGGFVVDTTNNTITGEVNHLTGFIVGSPGGEGNDSSGSEEEGGGSEESSPSNGGGGGGGGDLSPFGSNPPIIEEGKELFLINNGDTSTDSREVTLTFAATNVKTVAISHDPEFTDASYETYVSSTSWTLSEGNGKKKVYVRFRSSLGGILPASATITLTGQGFDAPDEDVEASTPCGLDKGGAYKSSGSAAVWYVTDDCTKRAFRSAQKFFTYFTDWSQVKEVPVADLNAVTNDPLGFMPAGPLYDPQYGALVKIVKDPKVYLLLGNDRHWITSEVVFEGLNYKWNWIEDVAEGLLDKYAEAGEITYTDHHPNYTLIKYENNPAVYRLEPDSADGDKQVKRYVKNETAFEALGFRWDRIVVVDDTETYADGEDLE